MKSPLLERVCGMVVSKSTPVIAAAMACAVGVSDVLAQNEELRPPTTQDPPSSPKFIVWGVAILLTGLVVFAATLKSKRGHQD
jgi:hypothetical protein